jgi:predicted dinucleotide-binding enzyme
MRVAVLGTGVVGQAISARLHELGHDVVIGTRDVASTVARADMPPGVEVLAFSDAAATGELIVLAVSGTAVFEVLSAAGAESLSGKVLIDISNSLDFSNGFPPTLSVKDTDSVGEQIQAAYPDVRVVKSLNTLAAALMVHPQLVGDGDHTVFSAATMPKPSRPWSNSCRASVTAMCSTSVTSVPVEVRRCTWACGSACTA